ncbi:MAG: hypothetical protein KGJ62_03115 [Armatimonadetes bacterium]|nr:hypothetical protein [Armatimonadota bacterium]MDE2207215.1 hypothetical protein [Armatimonadota bacterium]
MTETAEAPITSFVVDRLGIEQHVGVSGLPLGEEERTQWITALGAAVQQKARLFTERRVTARSNRGVPVPGRTPYRIAAGFHLTEVTRMEYVLSTMAFTLLSDRVPVLSFVPMPAAASAETLNPGGALAMLIAWRMVASGSDTDAQYVSAISPVMEGQVAEMLEARPAVAILHRAYPQDGVMDVAVPIAIRFAQIVIGQFEDLSASVE